MKYSKKEYEKQKQKQKFKSKQKIKTKKQLYEKILNEDPFLKDRLSKLKGNTHPSLAEIIANDYNYWENRILQEKFHIAQKEKLKEELKKQKQQILDKKRNRKIEIQNIIIDKKKNTKFKNLYGFDSDHNNILRLLQKINLEIEFGKYLFRKFHGIKLVDLFEEKGDLDEILNSRFYKKEFFYKDKKKILENNKFFLSKGMNDDEIKILRKFIKEIKQKRILTPDSELYIYLGNFKLKKYYENFKSKNFSDTYSIFKQQFLELTFGEIKELFDFLNFKIIKSIKNNLNSDLIISEPLLSINLNKQFKSLYGYDSDKNNILRFFSDIGLSKYGKQFKELGYDGIDFSELFEEEGRWYEYGKYDKSSKEINDEFYKENKLLPEEIKKIKDEIDEIKSNRYYFKSKIYLESLSKKSLLDLAEKYSNTSDIKQTEVLQKELLEFNPTSHKNTALIQLILNNMNSNMLKQFVLNEFSDNFKPLKFENQFFNLLDTINLEKYYDNFINLKKYPINFELPPEWEQISDVDGNTIYVNHNTKTKLQERPLYNPFLKLVEKGKLKPDYLFVKTGINIFNNKKYLSLLKLNNIPNLVINKISNEFTSLYQNYNSLDILEELFTNIHSISGIANFIKIKLKIGPLLLNFGDLHTFGERKHLESDKWLYLCDNFNLKKKKYIQFIDNNKSDKNLDKINYKTNEIFIETDEVIPSNLTHEIIDHFITKKKDNIQLNLINIIKNNEIFISYLILYILYNLKNVHLFFEHRKHINYVGPIQHITTPLIYIKAIVDFLKKKPEFLKRNNNFIHYNDFRTNRFIFFKLLEIVKINFYFLSGTESLQMLPSEFHEDNPNKIKYFRIIYSLIFLQGFKTVSLNPKLQMVNKLIDFENKPLTEILINDIGINSEQMKTFISEIPDDTYKSMTTLKINGEIIHCTRLSKQLLKLKPEIQEKVVEWFYDLILNTKKFLQCINIKTNNVNFKKVINEENFNIDNLKRLLHKTPELNFTTISEKIENESETLDLHYIAREYYKILEQQNNNYLKETLEISYLFEIMFIDFYNLCRILYYSGFNNDTKDMTKNIIINYGGENLFENRLLFKKISNGNCIQIGKNPKLNERRIFVEDITDCYEVFDDLTGGHISSIAFFYRKYLYKQEGKDNEYIYSKINNAHFKNNHIKIDKFTRLNQTDKKDCVKIK